MSCTPFIISSVTLRYLIYIFLVAVFALPARAAEQSPYNKGVAAWRVKDYAEARKQWEQSLAEGGPDAALNNLAFLYFHGLGGAVRTGPAVELWRKGAA